MDGKVLADKRRHVRFKAKEGAFAVLNSEVSKVGQIVDISMGGLALLYMANGTPSNGSYVLDILLADNGFYLEKVPYECITDFQLPNKFPFSTLVMKRQGVKFGQLTGHQTSKLEEFIEKHTTGTA